MSATAARYSGVLPWIRSIRANGIAASFRLSFGLSVGRWDERSGPVIELGHTTVPVGVGDQEGRPALPALPEGIDVLEALIERRGVHRKLREGDRGRHRNIRERWRLAAEQPLAAIG